MMRNVPLTACTGHYLALNPPPDPASWQDIADKEERMRVALTAVYAYHRRTEKMFASAAVAMERSATLLNPVSFALVVVFAIVAIMTMWYLSATALKPKDLRGVDLSGADLSEANL